MLKRTALWLALVAVVGLLDLPPAARANPAERTERIRPGQLDPTFAEDGRVTANLGAGEETAFTVCVQPDGKILVGGSMQNHAFIARYDADGHPDPTWNDDGLAVAQIGTSEHIYDMLIQPDGAILAAGDVWTASGAQFLLLRYSPAGDLEQTITTDFSASYDHGFALALQPDGKIVMVGQIDAGAEIGIARYTSDLRPDAGFGSAGKVRLDLPGSQSALDVAIQPDGKLVLTGWTAGAAGTDILVARRLADGRPDPAFGTGGSLTTALPSPPDLGFTSLGAALALQDDGAILVTGSVPTDDAKAPSALVLVRYTAAGGLDSSFANAGILITQIAKQSSTANDIRRLPDGTIVVAGQVGFPVPDAMVAYFRPNGAPDPRFGTTGATLTDFGGEDAAMALAIQPDGKAIVVGRTTADDEDSLAIARYANLFTTHLPRIAASPHGRARTP